MKLITVEENIPAKFKLFKFGCFATTVTNMAAGIITPNKAFGAELIKKVK